MELASSPGDQRHEGLHLSHKALDPLKQRLVYRPVALEDLFGFTDTRLRSPDVLDQLCGKVDRRERALGLFAQGRIGVA